MQYLNVRIIIIKCTYWLYLLQHNLSSSDYHAILCSGEACYMPHAFTPSHVTLSEVSMLFPLSKGVSWGCFSCRALRQICEYTIQMKCDWFIDLLIDWHPDHPLTFPKHSQKPLYGYLCHLNMLYGSNSMRDLMNALLHISDFASYDFFFLLHSSETHMSRSESDALRPLCRETTHSLLIAPLAPCTESAGTRLQSLCACEGTSYISNAYKLFIMQITDYSLSHLFLKKLNNGKVAPPPSPPLPSLSLFFTPAGNDVNCSGSKPGWSSHWGSVRGFNVFSLWNKKKKKRQSKGEDRSAPETRTSSETPAPTRPPPAPGPRPAAPGTHDPRRADLKCGSWETCTQRNTHSWAASRTLKPHS